MARGAWVWQPRPAKPFWGNSPHVQYSVGSPSNFFKRFKTPQYKARDPRIRSMNTARVRNMVIGQQGRIKNWYGKRTARSQANRLKSSRNTRSWNVF